MKKRIAFALIMGVITTGLISFTVIAFNIGFVSAFPALWLRSWAVAYSVVIPAILFLAPVIQRLVDKMFALPISGTVVTDDERV